MDRLVSVVVPIYNTEHFLDRCIQSIQNQTYKDIEIILVNDGSTDTSGKICDAYAKNDDRIIVIHQENGRLPSARMAGIEISKGKYITFVDSDDYVSDCLIEKMVNDMLVYDVDMVAYNAYYVDNGRNKYIVGTKYHGIYSDMANIINNILNYKIKSDAFFSGVVSKMFSRKIIFDNHVKYDLSLVTISDTLFCIEYLFNCGRIYCCGQPHYYYVMNNDSNSRKKIQLKQKWENYKKYLTALSVVVENCKYPQLLTSSYSEYIACMDSTMTFGMKDISCNIFERRNKISSILIDKEFVSVINKIETKNLSNRNKINYFLQKYRLVYLYMIREYTKNIVRKMIRK